MDETVFTCFDKDLNKFPGVFRKEIAIQENFR